MMHYGLVMVCWMLGAVVEYAGSQSVPDPLFSRGCRAQRGQFPHETYCQQYYNCWDGRATIEECPGKLLFNPIISACDYPEAVNCLARLRNPEPSVTSDGRCLKQFGIFPDPIDCTAFYECSHGRAFRQVCPYYTAFDERYSVCVHAYSVECGGRGGIYGTLAPPLFNIPDGGLSSQLGLPPSGSGTAASGWDRRGSASSGFGSQSPPPMKGSSHGTGIRRSGASSNPRNTEGSSVPNGSRSEGGTATEIQGSGSPGKDSRAPNGIGSERQGPESEGKHPTSEGDATSNGAKGSEGASGSAGSGNRAGGVSRGAGGTGVSRGSGRIGGGISRGSGNRAAAGSRSGTGSAGGTNASLNGAGGSGSVGGGSKVESLGYIASRGTHAGITGIVDRVISATGQERQYERPISPEATFRCPHPRGLYPNALDCSRFWLCREYKPSLLKCPTGQLFDLASLSCLNPEKAQCSSISPRT